MGRAGGTSGMREENLKVWLREATREKDQGTRCWDKLASVTNLAFREGHTPAALVWKTMVLITKGRREYTGIGVVDVIWKVCV